MQVERLDHHGVVAGVIDDLGIVEMIDEMLGTDEQEEISMGEAVKGMIINGLGFSDKPVSLTPLFFEQLPVEALFRPGVKGEHFNRHKLGRTLDALHAYGCDTAFSRIAMQACQMESVDQRFNSLDTTSFSLTGRYDSDFDEHEIQITYGHSKDHRPDLKQAVQEMLVSQDGGIPLLTQSHHGNANDSVIFKERAEALLKNFKQSDGPRYLIGDSKLYCKKAAPTLAQMGFITRIPGTLKLEGEQIAKACHHPEQWRPLEQKGYRYQSVQIEHYEMNQRWLICSSEQARERARKRMERHVAKELKSLDSALLHLQANRFDSPECARRALAQIAQTTRYHTIHEESLNIHKRYAGRGRPGPNTSVEAIEHQITATYTSKEAEIERQVELRGCFIISTNIHETELSDIEVFQAYKNQSKVEHGFRFLKDPLFFVSSLFLKKPARIEALLTIMTLALLVYSVAQRQLRKAIAQREETIPNQINRPISTPTLRWVFQLLEGINRVIWEVDGNIQTEFIGITDLKRQLLSYFSPGVRNKYELLM